MNASSMLADAPTGFAGDFVTHLRLLASSRPRDTALVVLRADAGTVNQTVIDYATLELRVRALAAVLQQRHAPGERALLLLDNDDTYAVGFLACLYAGLVAVPAFPPESARPQHLARLIGIAADARAGCVISNSAVLDMVGPAMAGFAGARALALDALEGVEGVAGVEGGNLGGNLGAAAQWRACTPAPSDIAFLQYTSGSTSAPKGVMVSHANLAANEVALQQGFGGGAEDVYVSWLPLFHDMGLIGGLLQPLFCAAPLVLMSPRFFLERPLRWLEAIARYRGTVSGAPDFAYRLCLERISPAQAARLDLSSWRLACSGAEPIRHDTLRDFAAHFADAGFAASALFPSYGLAEATLIVSGGRRGDGMRATTFGAAELALGRGVPSEHGSTLVGCGASFPGHALRIVDPVSGLELEPGAVGEIWASGPSIAAGYWGNTEATHAAFIERQGMRWLRTGDLGLLRDGQLYVTGRLKDMIIVHGQNLYPQDVERAVETGVSAVRKGRVAAFAVNSELGEGIGVAAEVSPATRRRMTPAALADAIGAAVAALCGEAPAVLVLLNGGGLPKTSSGKLQRSACASGWRDDSLDAYAIYQHGAWRGALAQARSTPVAAALNDTEMAVATIWRAVLKLPEAAALDRDSHFFNSGGNSLSAVQVSARIGERWQIAFPMRAVFDRPRLGQCAAAIATMLAAPERPDLTDSLTIPVLPRDGAAMPLSPAQQRLWLIDRLGDGASYNQAIALEIVGELDLTLLRGALDAVIARHEVLYTAYPDDEQGDPVALVGVPQAMPIALIDLSGDAVLTPQAQRADRLGALYDELARQPFVLASGPLLRASVVRMAPRRHVLLLVLHHIVFDGWSGAVLAREFGAFYQALLANRAPALPALPIQYADYARWHQQAIASGSFEASGAFWRRYLEQAPAISSFPTDYRRPAAASHAGDSLRLQLDADLTAQISRLARACNTTLFTVTLAAFLLLLHRQSGSRDCVVGTDFAGRSHPHLEGLIGFFVNLLPLRSRLQGNAPGFTQWLDGLKQQVLAALEHPELPFDQIVDTVGVPRERGCNPLVQVLFVLHNTPEEQFDIPGLCVKPLALPTRQAKFDLAVFAREGSAGLAVEWVFATDLLARETVQRLADGWRQLLIEVVASPGTPIDKLTFPLRVPGPLPGPVATANKMDRLKQLVSGADRVRRSEPAVRTSFLTPDSQFPIVIEGAAGLDAVAWARANGALVESLLRKHGGILFRHIGLVTPQDFEVFAEAIEPQLYGGYGDLPRKEGGRNTYRSTPYPQRQMILFHNESAHLERWPRKQWFFCELAAPVGGATPIVDCRQMLRRLPPELVQRFEQKGLTYVRTFTPGIDVAWQDFFKTEDPARVEAQLARDGTGWSWIDGGILQTRTRCPAVITHPVTGERVFFNQVQLHHPSCLEPDVRDDLLALVGAGRLPRNVCYGDGTLIDDQTMAQIGAAYEACAVRFAWRQGDVVMLDNMLAAHARDPFEGPRKVVVAMGAMWERSALATGIDQQGQK